MQKFLGLSLLALAASLVLAAPESNASTMGIDEVTSLRSTAHSLMENKNASKEAQLETANTSHWLLINDNLKWEWDETALQLDDAFVNTNYDSLNVGTDETALKFDF